ncbi:ABC transporter permease subunit [Streptomyces sp. NPDC047082]|uniref:ABC transporter permease subunit n=1 Tax=Streptomyces sp. NPDC047082 TaxID=3155259 RepID=UPI0033EF5263
MTSAALQGLPRVVLRLHRPALLIWTALVTGLIGRLVWLNEVTADHVRAAVGKCDRVMACADLLASLDYSDPVGHIGTFICRGFLAVAVFAGGALIGRELESGTARLAWTQGVTPARWLTAKLAVPALALTVGGTAQVLAFRWGWGANHDLMDDNWTFDDVFVARGPLAVAYALCALAVGTLLALLLRRALAAAAAAVAVMWLLNLVLELNRAALWPGVTRTSPKPFKLPHDVWEVSSGRNAGGRFAVYHPESHYWPLHLVETGIVLTLAALATTAAYAVLRRRAA